MTAAMVVSGAGINAAVIAAMAGNDRFCGRCLGARAPNLFCTDIPGTPATAVVVVSVCSEWNYTFFIYDLVCLE